MEGELAAHDAYRLLFYRLIWDLTDQFDGDFEIRFETDTAITIDLDV